ncbi:MAG TPA: DNA-3-methyladenine glycosylase [Paludibacteraceae bacterium]|nr:DNA-3-methyladenine glycosylase [Paludibacteraceae bacterium]
MERLDMNFYALDAVTVAQQLLGKEIVRRWDNGSVSRYVISETEAYFGEDDKACHASKGRTLRTEIMYSEGGYVYVYLIYGMYWMLNVVTGEKSHPEAVLIRGINDIVGSGKVGRELKLDKSFYGESLISSSRIWIENPLDSHPIKYVSAPRVGVDYAGEEWRNKPWRFILQR